ncbi:ABC-type transport auxiliary lipoprotein family protein [Maridesulfovibrio hydrothermalis]|uniref:ABC-type transport auxiliary lipoprotein component domain-containing protein n=1 Tax=Maridesulfovibrio hydrothermalis AM13 = DSM 14728 TaxID=1121451 RepID=L0RHY4_9BACT|nr:ABC-type transport auxiliary lipoprotein family protein [Maridesulfovibrio hydrothermalis]CCO25206.1 conserved exported protein of unknown function [Maridesulfovibrio hydrothermalis AM13 = DSM 14728]
MKTDYSTQMRIMKVAVLGLTAVLSFFAFAGCVKLERPTLDRKFYTLDVKREGVSAQGGKSEKNLIVRRIKISPRYEDRDLVYRVGVNEFEADYYNAFFVAPASLMTQELRLWMRDSGLFTNVVSPESMGTGELLLEGVVNSIYGDYTGGSSKAVIEMQFFLLDNNDPDMPIVYSRNFSKAIPAKETGADALVRAMNKGLKEIFTELESDIAELVRKRCQEEIPLPVSQEK